MDVEKKVLGVGHIRRTEFHRHTWRIFHSAVVPVEAHVQVTEFDDISLHRREDKRNETRLVGAGLDLGDEMRSRPAAHPAELRANEILYRLCRAMILSQVRTAFE